MPGLSKNYFLKSIFLLCCLLCYGEIGKARSGVARYIKRSEKELRFRGQKQLIRSEILADRSVDETQHDLETRLFTIYHLFIAI